MQLTSVILFLSATAVSVSALPGALPIIKERQASGANSTTSPKSAGFACDHAGEIIGQQLAEMKKLKAQNIDIPPYLAGYYTAINSGRQEIGCPGPIPIGKRDFTPIKQPCDIINEQHERMMELVNRFEAENISVAPFIAGFFTATLDGHSALSCPPFTGPATEAAANGGTALDATASASMPVDDATSSS